MYSTAPSVTVLLLRSLILALNIPLPEAQLPGPQAYEHYLQTVNKAWIEARERAAKAAETMTEASTARVGLDRKKSSRKELMKACIIDLET